MSNSEQKGDQQIPIKGNDIEILKEHNPEVFTIPAEPGHSTLFKNDSKENIGMENDTSTDNSETSPSQETSWSRIQTAMKEVWRQKEVEMVETDGPDYNHMLPVVLSTVILLATSPNAAPMEYLMWTEKYLTCIKDENGCRPYNIANILRMIRKHCKEMKYEWNPEWGLTPADEARMTRKRLKQELKEAKRASKEIKKTEKLYERRESSREALEKKRNQARRKDSELVQKELEKLHKNGDAVGSKTSKDSISNGSKISKRSRSSGASGNEDEMKHESRASLRSLNREINSSPRGSRSSSPAGSVHSGTEEKSDLMENDQPRQAGGANPPSRTHLSICDRDTASISTVIFS